MIAFKFAPAFAAIVALGAAGAASATEFQSNGKTVEVNYHDLDLSSAKGQNMLKGRIWRAAWKVCADGATSAEMKKCQSSPRRMCAARSNWRSPRPRAASAMPI